MSWNNVIPFWMLMVDIEERDALSLCAFPEELKAGWLYSVPPEFSRRVRVYEFTDEELAELKERNKPLNIENPLASLEIDW